MNTPIALIIYHRPEMTAKVINSLREIKATEIFIIADGPKNELDAERCKETRALINSIDWKCKIYKNYSPKNLGLRKRVVSGLDWVFSKVDRAIILEDDLVVDKSFYRFCEEMLEKYKNNTRIISVAGDNFLFDKYKIKESYFFSRYTYPWGWATWRRAWKLYDDTMRNWPGIKKLKVLKNSIKEFGILTYWSKVFDLIYQRNIDSWAYCWTYTAFVNSMLSVVPYVNLVSNVGIGKGATHTLIKSKVFGMPTLEMHFPLRYAKKVVRDSRADLIIERNLYLTQRSVIVLILQSVFYRIKGQYERFFI
jgi:GR25 family glycosyltransferase involved in LPS biosynthesis